ncbi:MAG: hypothetical protein KAJ33_04605, partial [Thermoplasmata archaeon]|nr:hypothetical protein [Thermoplasmata archaeon]
VYDTVYVDLDNDKNFSNDKPCTVGDEISYFDCYDPATDTYDYTHYDAGDGLADISGGMIYYISDNETAIPYLGTFLERSGIITNKTSDEIDKYIPESGNLVAFFGEFGKGSISGTETASAIAGQGKTIVTDAYTGDRKDIHQVVGTAPDAKIIGIASSGGLFDSWFFAVEGYDGDPTTVDDQSQITTNGFGFGNYNDGWDIYSKFADWVTMVYAGGNTLFTASAGDSGGGYGTVTAPATAPGVLCVGGITDFSSRVPAGLESGPHFTYGEVASMSSNGPSALGLPEPDVLAVSRQAYGALPINTMGTVDGSVAADIWMGNAVASAYAAGVLGLIYEAYMETTHGNITDEFPDADIARQIVTSSCDDLKYDVLVQGAGLINAERAVDVAMETAGITTDTPYWVPGDFEGVKYEAFTSLMYPGETDNTTIRINNHGSADADITIRDQIHVKTGEFTAEWAVPKTGSQEFWGYIPNPGNGFTGFGIMDEDGNLIGEGDPDLWMDAEFVKLTASANLEDLDGNGDGVLDYDYWLDLYDWTDMDNGLDLDHGGYAEVNRLMMNSDGTSNVREVKLQQPYHKTHTGLAIFLRTASVAPYDEAINGTVWTFTLETFKRADWDWLTLSDSGALTLDEEGMDLMATVNVPADAPVGSYEAGIYIDEERTITDESIVQSTTNYVANEFIDDTPTITKNISIANSSATDVVNTSLIDTSVRSVTKNEIINTNVTLVTDEHLITTESTPTNETMCNTTSTYIDNTFVDGTGVPVQVINDYIGLINETIDNATLSIASNSLIYEPSLTIYKNGTIWTDSLIDVTNEVLNSDYRNNDTLFLDNTPIEDGSYKLYTNGVEMTEGDDFELNLTTGEVDRINVDLGGIFIENETLFTSVIGGETGPFFLANTDILYCRIFLQSGGMWAQLDEGTPTGGYNEYTLNYATGEVNLVDIPWWWGQPLLAGDVLYAQYEYLDTPAIITADYSYHSDYMLDSATGKLYFTTMDYKGHLTADFQYYGMVTEFELDCDGEADAVLIDGSWTIYEEDIPLVEGTDYTIDLETRTVTMIKVLGPNTNLYVDYGYYFPVENDQTLEYGRDIWQEDYNAYANFTANEDDLYIWQEFTPTKENLLGFEVFIEKAIPTNDPSTNIKAWLVNKTGYESEPSTGEYLERDGDIFEILEKGKIYNSYIKGGWNTVLFNETYILNMSHEYSLIVKNWNGAGVGYDIGYYNADVYSGEFYRAKNLENTSWSSALTRDLAFRTFNGEIAPGSFNAQLNGATWNDAIVSEVGEIVWNVETTRVYGEAIQGEEWYYTDEVWDAYSYNLTHRYAEEIDYDALAGLGLEAEPDTEVYYTYVMDMVVYCDGVPLTEGWDYELYGSPQDPPLWGYNYEYHIGVINFFGNYTMYNISVDYTYFSPGVDIGGFGLDPTNPADNTMLPMQLDYGLVTDLTLKKNGVPLTEGPDYSLNPVNGTILLDQSQQLGPNDILTADYDRHEKYDINMTTGNFTFVETVPEDSLVELDYSYYTKFMGNMQLSVGTNAVGTGWMITSVFIDSCEIIMDGETILDPSYYTLNETSGTITLLKPLLANNSFTANFEYYRNIVQFAMGAGDAEWSERSWITGTPTISKNNVPWPAGNTTYKIEDSYALIVFNQSWSPLPPDTWITGTFDWYPYIPALQLEHGSSSLNDTTTIIPGSHTVYNNTVEMTEGVDYNFDSDVGLLTFLGGTLGVASHIEMSYTYYDMISEATLLEDNITALTLWNETTEYTAYTFDSATGEITFTPALSMGELMWAEYSYLPRKIKKNDVYELDNSYLIGGSWTVYNNGTEIDQSTWYEMRPTEEGEILNASIKFLAEIPPDWNINISYSYYVPVTFAYVSVTNSSIISWDIRVGATTLVDGVDYKFEPYKGIVHFTNPLHPGELAYATYTYALTTTIPVLINIASDSPLFDFGGESVHTQELFNNSRINTGFTGGGGSGDWRFFFVEVPETGLYENGDLKFLLDISWENRLTDINAFVFGKTLTPSIPAIGDTFPTSRYGPYSLTDNGGSDETGSFFTTTDGPREIVAPPLTSGLNTIAINNAQFNGTKISESISGRVGSMTATPDEVLLTTNSLLGETQVTLSSNMEWEGLGATAAGPSAPISEKNLTIAQDDENWAN